MLCYVDYIIVSFDECLYSNKNNLKKGNIDITLKD